MDDSAHTSKAYVGAGIEWTPQIAQEIEADLRKVDCIEIISENFFYHNHDVLKRLGASGKPVLVHAVELSIGSADGFKASHFEKILRIADQVNAVNVSDHLAFCEYDGVETVQPAILPWTAAAADAVCRNIEQIQRRTDLPFLFENEANRYQFRHAEMSEPAFINSILSRTGCHLLLDVTNLYTNAINFGVEPYAYLDELNLGRVHTVHLAGGSYDRDGDLLDSHDNPVPDPVWELFAYVLERVDPVCTIVERTESRPDFNEIIAEIGRAREMMEAKRGHR